MDMKEFAQKVCHAVERELGEAFTVEMKEVRKNNGVLFHGLMINARDCNVAPTIYLEQFWQAYNEGMTFADVIRKLLEVYRKDQPVAHVDMNFFRDFGKVQDRICYRLVGVADNRELLSDIPHVVFLDMAVCFYYAYRGELLGEGSILIHNSHMKMWNTCTEELMRLAGENTPRLYPWQCSSMAEVLREVLGEEQVKELLTGDVPMKILSNRQRVQGAVCLIYNGVLEKLAEEYKSDLYILPSSVHEVILLTDSGRESAAELKSMIVQVNHTQLVPEEVLSNSLYHYNRLKKRIEVIF